MLSSPISSFVVLLTFCFGSLFILTCHCCRLPVEVAYSLVFEELSHVILYLLISYLGINLSSANVRMTEHTRNGFYGYAFAQCQRCECVTGHVKGQLLIDAACRCNLFQISIGLLIGIDRKYMTFLLRGILVLLYDELCTLKENYIDGNLCLDTLGDNPFHAVKLDDILWLQCLDIDICEAGEAGEDEQVAYELKSLNVELLSHDGLNLFVSEETTVNCIQVHTDTQVWILVDDPKFDAVEDNGLERLQRLYCRVIAHANISHQVVLVVLYNDRVELHK